MEWRHLFVVAVGAGILGAAGGAGAAGRSLAPIPQEQAVSTHGPFEMGDCGTCHVGKAPSPGKLLKPASDLCLDCHEDFAAQVAKHPRVKGNCTMCHSPHNARKKKLLL